jgi:hypothetical protein
MHDARTLVFCSSQVPRRLHDFDIYAIIKSITRSLHVFIPDKLPCYTTKLHSIELQGLGARILLEVPEQAPRVHQRLLECCQLA